MVTNSGTRFQVYWGQTFSSLVWVSSPTLHIRLFDTQVLPRDVLLVPSPVLHYEVLVLAGYFPLQILHLLKLRLVDLKINRVHRIRMA